MIVDRYSGLDGSGGPRRRLVTDTNTKANVRGMAIEALKLMGLRNEPPHSLRHCRRHFGLHNFIWTSLYTHAARSSTPLRARLFPVLEVRMWHWQGTLESSAVQLTRIE